MKVDRRYRQSSNLKKYNKQSNTNNNTNDNYHKKGKLHKETINNDLQVSFELSFCTITIHYKVCTDSSKSNETSKENRKQHSITRHNHRFSRNNSPV